MHYKEWLTLVHWSRNGVKITESQLYKELSKKRLYTDQRFKCDTGSSVKMSSLLFLYIYFIFTLLLWLKWSSLHHVLCYHDFICVTHGCCCDICDCLYSVCDCTFISFCCYCISFTIFCPYFVQGSCSHVIIIIIIFVTRWHCIIIEVFCSLLPRPKLDEAFPLAKC